MVMRYIFNNFKLISRCIMEREKFTFDSAEFINSVFMMVMERYRCWTRTIQLVFY